jgi:hypothetical protein
VVDRPYGKRMTADVHKDQDRGREGVTCVTPLWGVSRLSRSPRYAKRDRE